MARIAGINIPPHKHTEIGLTSIYGIGRRTAQKICDAAGVAYDKKQFGDPIWAPVFTGYKPAKAWLDEMKASGECSAKPGEMAVLHQPQGFKAKRLVALGGGKKDKFDAAALRKSVGSLTRALKQKGVKRLALLIFQFGVSRWHAARNTLLPWMGSARLPAMIQG